MRTAATLIPDSLWDLIEPLLPPPITRPQGGRPRLSDRACLTGIVFVLRSGIPWSMLPRELGCGSGMSCWRRLRDWQQAGLWDLLHLLNTLSRTNQIDWSCAVVDSCSQGQDHWMRVLTDSKGGVGHRLAMFNNQREMLRWDCSELKLEGELDRSRSASRTWCSADSYTVCVESGRSSRRQWHSDALAYELKPLRRRH